MIARDITNTHRSIWVNEKWIDLFNGQADVSEEDAFILAHNKNFRIDSSIKEFDQNTWSDSYKKLIWDTPTIAEANGYGSVSEQMMLTLDKIGVDVYSPAKIVDSNECMDKRLYDITKKPISPDSYAVVYSLPDYFDRCRVEKRIGYSMFENTKLPKNWVDECNKMIALLVPSQQQKEVFKDNGVRVPIHVLHHGISQELFHYVERPAREKYTFLIFGAPLTLRKGADIIHKAFKAAFPFETDVELFIKTTEPLWSWDGMGDKRCKFMFNSIPAADMIHLLQQVDCMVFPTRGEGFGLPPLQAMATGLPTIVTNYSGCAEYADKKYCFPLDYDVVDSPHWNTGGQWAEPDFDHLVELMRYCYKNRSIANEKGRAAAEWVKANWSWEKQAKNLINIIDCL